MYAIKSNRTIDVGLIIHHSIHHGVTKDNAGLYNPSLITALCKVAGVVWSKSEEIQQPKYIIGNKLLRIIKNDNEEDRGLGLVLLLLPCQINLLPWKTECLY